MVDGVVLLVDAAEGCMPQTRFVLQKALEAHPRFGKLFRLDPTFQPVKEVKVAEAEASAPKRIKKVKVSCLDDAKEYSKRANKDILEDYDSDEIIEHAEDDSIEDIWKYTNKTSNEYFYQFFLVLD